MLCSADYIGKAAEQKYLNLTSPTPATSSPLVRFTSSYQDPTPDACTRTIQSLLGDCFRNHNECVTQFGHPLPTRLLDLSESCIRLAQPSRDDEAPYIALSHCWGLACIATTTTSNFTARKQNIAIKELPKTFQDAIEITRGLGVHYLWIDSLCIIQDSEADWERESSKMASIYKNAYLTVAASRSSDGSGGCFSTLGEAPYIWRTPFGTLVEKTTSTFVSISKVNLWEPFWIARPGAAELKGEPKRGF